ncbi:MAG: ATP synthase F1 subunit gamma [Deltaproteobacteria bacterium]|nr:MAG: ATP synthase F1 subunit gamma [Deltaproteobacteria bacterium]
MANLREIRKRLASIKKTQQITRAMKLIAAVKLQRAQERVTAFRPYADKIDELVGSLVYRLPSPVHPFLRPGSASRVLFLVLTSDRGFCGSFNTNIFREVDSLFRAPEREETSLLIIGRKGSDYFRRRAYPIEKEWVGISDDLDYPRAVEITSEIIVSYLKGSYREINLVYNEFKSAFSRRVLIKRLLPLEPKEAKEGTPYIDYLYEPSREVIVQELLPKQVETQTYRTFLESTASEHGARMIAMDSATSNATEMIDRLTLDLNRARQEAITKELMDIIGGAEALRG